MPELVRTCRSCKAHRNSATFYRECLTVAVARAERAETELAQLRRRIEQPTRIAQTDARKAI